MATTREGEQKTSSKTTNLPVWICKGTMKRGRKFYSQRTNLTWTVLMASWWYSHDKELPFEMFSTRDSRGGYIMICGACSLNGTMDLQVGQGLHKQWLAMWRCCSSHPSWLRALVCAMMAWSFNRTTLQFTTPNKQRTSSTKTTLLFWTIVHVPLVLIPLRTFEDGWQGKFTKTDVRSMLDRGFPLWSCLHHMEQCSHQPPGNTWMRHA